MADPHQVNSIIATAICDCRKDHPGNGLDPEEAKQIAKCIIAALTDAGFKIAPEMNSQARLQSCAGKKRGSPMAKA